MTAILESLIGEAIQRRVMARDGGQSSGMQKTAVSREWLLNVMRSSNRNPARGDAYERVKRILRRTHPDSSWWQPRTNTTWDPNTKTGLTYRSLRLDDAEAVKLAKEKFKRLVESTGKFLGRAGLGAGAGYGVIQAGRGINSLLGGDESKTSSLERDTPRLRSIMSTLKLTPRSRGGSTNRPMTTAALGAGVGSVESMISEALTKRKGERNYGLAAAKGGVAGAKLTQDDSPYYGRVPPPYELPDKMAGIGDMASGLWDQGKAGLQDALADPNKRYLATTGIGAAAGGLSSVVAEAANKRKKKRYASALLGGAAAGGLLGGAGTYLVDQTGMLSGDASERAKLPPKLDAALPSDPQARAKELMDIEKRMGDRSMVSRIVGAGGSLLGFSPLAFGAAAAYPAAAHANARLLSRDSQVIPQADPKVHPPGTLRDVRGWASEKLAPTATTSPGTLANIRQRLSSAIAPSSTAPTHRASTVHEMPSKLVSTTAAEMLGVGSDPMMGVLLQDPKVQHALRYDIDKLPDALRSKVSPAGRHPRDQALFELIDKVQDPQVRSTLQQTINKAAPPHPTPQISQWRRHGVADLLEGRSRSAGAGGRVAKALRSSTGAKSLGIFGTTMVAEQLLKNLLSSRGGDDE